MSTFLQRIQSLQNLCKIYNNRSNKKRDIDKPEVLLFIFGQDASRKINKYLFFVLRYLFVDSQFSDNDYEDLNELVLLIQNNSVAVIWTYVVNFYESVTLFHLYYKFFLVL